MKEQRILTHQLLLIKPAGLDVHFVYLVYVNRLFMILTLMNWWFFFHHLILVLLQHLIPLRMTRLNEGSLLSLAMHMRYVLGQLVSAHGVILVNGIDRMSRDGNVLSSNQTVAFRLAKVRRQVWVHISSRPLRARDWRIEALRLIHSLACYVHEVAVVPLPCRFDHLRWWLLELVLSVWLTEVVASEFSHVLDKNLVVLCLYLKLQFEVLVLSSLLLDFIV